MNLIFYRRLVQIFTVVGLILVPFFNVFRLDIPTKSFILLGQKLFMKETYIVILSLLIFVFLLFGLIKLLGRVPCGWICPRNTFTEIVDFFLKRKGSAAWLWKTLGIVIIFALAYVVSLVTMAYFFDWKLLVSDSFGFLWTVPSVLTWAFALFVFVDMLFIRHIFCKSACPYGMMQNIFTDDKTMKINFDPTNCIHCNACVRACFLGVDPKTEALDTCVACGDCTVACEQIFAKAKKEPPASLAFHFGVVGKNFTLIQLLTDKRFLFLGGIVLVMSSILAFAALNHKDIMAVILPSKYEKPEIIDRVNGRIIKNYLINMSNTASEDKNIHVKVVGLPEKMVKITPDKLTLKKGETLDIMMTITVNKGELESGKAHPFSVQITDDAGNLLQEDKNQFYMLSLD